MNIFSSDKNIKIRSGKEITTCQINYHKSIPVAQYKQWTFAAKRHEIILAIFKKLRPRQSIIDSQSTHRNIRHAGIS